MDNIDVKAATDKGITVTSQYALGVLTEDTADMTMALIRARPRRMVDRRGGDGRRQVQGLGAQLDARPSPVGQAAGHCRVAGPHQGQAVARRAHALGLQIHYHNRKQVALKIEQELEATYWESLDQMLARMDIVSINCPHTPATFHLLCRPGG